MLFVPVGMGGGGGGRMHMCMQVCILYMLMEDCEELIIAPFSRSKLSQCGESR